MIDAIVRLIDRLIDAVREREKGKRTLQTDFVDPLMRSVDELHRHYLAALESMAMSSAEAKRLGDADLKLEAHIAEALMRRTTVTGSSASLSIASSGRLDFSGEIESFIDVVEDYLHRPGEISDALQQSAIITMKNPYLDALFIRAGHRQVIEGLRQELDSRYGRVVEAYGKLKARLLT